MGDESVLERPHRVCLVTTVPVSFIWELDINSLSFFFLFWFCFGCGILLLQPGIKPMSLTIGSLESPPLDHQGSPQSVIKIFPIFFTLFPPHKTCPWITMMLVPSLFFFFLVMRLLGFTSPRFFGVLIVMEESWWMHFLKTSVPCKMSPARRKKCIIQDVELLMMTFQAPLKGRLGLVWTLPTSLPVTSCL